MEPIDRHGSKAEARELRLRSPVLPGVERDDDPQAPRRGWRRVRNTRDREVPPPEVVLGDRALERVADDDDVAGSGARLDERDGLAKLGEGTYA